MEKIIIIPLMQELSVSGETASGNFSTGKCNIYKISSEKSNWNIDMGYTFWDNGEEELTAKNAYPSQIESIKNRLRMVVSKCDLPDYPNAKIITLRVAFRRNEGTNEWSNLRNLSMGELSELAGGNAHAYFKKLGALALDYKVDLYNQTGSTANQLVVIFPNDNIEVPISAFVVTRVIALMS